MAKLRKSTKAQRRGSSTLIEEIEKLAAALERNATHKLGHHFGKLGESLGEMSFSCEKPEEA